MLYLLISILGILLTIFFVVGTHEAGHFYMARLLKVKVLRFSIGFGKTLFRWHDKSGTEYVFALIPLGGYVKMLDETEGLVSPQEVHLAYNRQPYYKKFLIVLAGPVTNLLCALLLYWGIFMVGFTTIKPVIGNVTPNSIAARAGLTPNQEIISVDQQYTSNWTGILLRLIAHLGDNDKTSIQTTNLTTNKVSSYQLDLNHWRIDELNPDPLLSIGIYPYQPTVPMIIGEIDASSTARLAGLKIGDKIIAINKTTVKNWEEFITTIQKVPEQSVLLTVKRDNQILNLMIIVGYKYNWLWEKKGYLGIAPKFEWPKNMLNRIQYSPRLALTHAWKEIADFTYFNFLLIGKMFVGKISLQSLGGPITIFESAGNALNSGLIAFFGFLAFLSVAIGIINFLPIPGLDGGHLFIQTIEAIIRRPLPDIVLVSLYRLGFLLLFFLMLQAFVNDVLRL